MENNYNDNLFDSSLTLEKMKDKLLQLLISLDNNLLAQGRILIDDFVSNDSKRKKIFIKCWLLVHKGLIIYIYFFQGLFV